MGHGRAKDCTFTKSSTSQGVATTTAATVSVPYWEDPEANSGQAQAQKKVEDPPPGPAGHDEMCHLVTSTFLSESVAPTHTQTHTGTDVRQRRAFFPLHTPALSSVAAGREGPGSAENEKVTFSLEATGPSAVPIHRRYATCPSATHCTTCTLLLHSLGRASRPCRQIIEEAYPQWILPRTVRTSQRWRGHCCPACGAECRQREDWRWWP